MKNIDWYHLIRSVSLSTFAFGVAAFAQPPRVEELWSHATIYRDEWGVPHVQADNFFAMSFAFGYAQAEDHIEGMLKAYRVANGRAAEVYGPDYAISDEFSLKMGHADYARAAYALVDPITRDLCDGFAMGVNAWLVEHPRHAPEWADGMRPEDILALMHCYLMSHAPFDLPDVFARPPASRTGNAWAVAPSRTNNGDTLLVINPHTDYRGPFQWYEAQLTCGEFNVSGATLYGLPVIVQGHNGILGWALTPNFSDFADVYAEPDPEYAYAPKNPANPTGRRNTAMDADTARYLEMVANSRLYYVKTPGGLEPRQVPFLDTPRGPIIGQYNGRFCSYLVGGYRDFGAVRQLFEMGKAGNLADFQQALALHQLPCFHVVYADREGNIFYLYNSKVGQKFTPPMQQQRAALAQAGLANPGEVVNWSAPLPGDNPKLAWGNLIPPSELPAVTNPPSGYVQACGNPPWAATEKTGIDPAAFPPWFAQDADSFRAVRVRRLLTLGRPSFEESQAMLYDVLSPIAIITVPKLIEMADKQPELIAKAHPDLPAGLDVLRNWNYVAEPSSEGMTFFHVWWSALCGIARGVPPYQLVRTLNASPAELQSVSLRAAEEAARLMRSEFQSLQVPWGDVHTLDRGSKSIPAPGAASGEPLFIASDFVFEEGKWRVTYGYGFAMVVAFGERTRAASMTPFGASDDPLSPHYDDQMDLVRDRKLKTVRFDPIEVRRHAVRAYGSAVGLAFPGMEGGIVVRADSPISLKSRIATNPPAPLPTGLATFTVYAALEQEPFDTPVAVEAEIYIPEGLCTAENLGQLAVFGHSEESGWMPLDAQQLDLRRRTLKARGRGLHTYAVLGPVGVRTVPDRHTRVLVAKAVEEAEERKDLAAKTLVEPPTMVPPVSVDSAPPAPNPVPEPIAPAPLPDGNVIIPAPQPAAGPVRPAAPDPEGPREGALAWGKRITLRPPGVDGLIQVRADKTIGARVIVTPSPPEPVPPGLAAFSECVQVDCQGEGVPKEVSVNLRVSADVVANAHLDSLRVYALDSAQGWIPLPDQKRNPEKREFSANDSSARTYALLGPAGVLVKAPSAN